MLAISDIHSMFSLFVCLSWSLFNDMCVDVSFLGNSFLFSFAAAVTAQNNDKCSLLASAVSVCARACRPSLCVYCVRVQILSILNP